MPDGLSHRRATAWGLLAAFLPAGAWLLWEIERTIGLRRPHLWELLRTDRVFDLAMLDFALTATWALLVLGDRAGWHGWRFWLSLAVFFAVPTLGIILFLLLDRRSVDPRRPVADHGPSTPGGPGPGADSTPGSETP